LVKLLYRLALGQSRRGFFQNEDDRQLFIESGLINPAVTDRLPGSGIDLATFSKVAFPAQLPFRFVLIARMLWDKGVGEYVEAARQLKRFGVNADFCLLGFLDVANPAAISRQQMEAWVADGFVQYLGEADDVRGTIASAHCVVLPSYREGTPRTLLEAAAMGRPIITTDAVGCREVVDDGVNGYQCKVRDATDLAGKMVQMMALPAAELAAMGQRGREKVERQFDEKIVIAKYLAVIEEINRDRK
jgi:glycosyltransferase involved in cell wall biosynthesis